MQYASYFFEIFDVDKYLKSRHNIFVIYHFFLITVQVIFCIMCAFWQTKYTHKHKCTDRKIFMSFSLTCVCVQSLTLHMSSDSNGKKWKWKRQQYYFLKYITTSNHWNIAISVFIFIDFLIFKFNLCKKILIQFEVLKCAFLLDQINIKSSQLFRSLNIESSDELSKTVISSFLSLN